MTIDTPKMIEGVNDYITELDSFRPQISIRAVYLSVYSTLLSHKNKNITNFIRKNPKLHEKIQKNLDPYFKKVVKITFKDVLKLFSGIILISLLGIILAIIYTNNLIKVVTGSINSLFFIYFLFWIYKSYKNTGEKYDIELKKAVQLIIDHGTEIAQKDGLNPEDFPIKLRHNDYKGLKYDKKGKNNYVGYFTR